MAFVTQSCHRSMKAVIGQHLNEEDFIHEYRETGLMGLQMEMPNVGGYVGLGSR